MDGSPLLLQIWMFLGFGNFPELSELRHTNIDFWSCSWGQMSELRYPDSPLHSHLLPWKLIPASMIYLCCPVLRWGREQIEEWNSFTDRLHPSVPLISSSLGRNPWALYGVVSVWRSTKSSTAAASSFKLLVSLSWRSSSVEICFVEICLLFILNSFLKQVFASELTDPWTF